MSSDHHFLIAGAKWLWRYARLRGQADGWTYLPDPLHPTMARKVLIDSRLAGRTRLETEIHELIHVLYPQLSEDSVTSAARDISKVLWHLGYRLQEDKQP
jgi:hypothetical protein